MAAVVFIAFFGFNFVLPILPLYVRTLGSGDVGQAALISGVMLAISPLLAAFFSPVWGLVADRYGRKRMVQRSLLVMVVCTILMGFVAHLWQLFLLRAAIGVFGGFTAMAMAYMVTVTPPEKASSALGLLQASQVGGVIVGPLCAGLVADHWGIRASFLGGAIVVFCGFLVLTLLTPDDRAAAAPVGAGDGPPPGGAPAGPRNAQGRSSTGSPRTDGSTPRVEGGTPRTEKPGNPLRGLATLGTAARLPGFFAVMAVLFCAQVVDRSFGPVLPLYVAALGTPEERVASFSGLVVSLGAIGTAISATVTGRLGARLPLLRLLVVTLVAGVALCLPMALAQSPLQLLVERTLLGLFAGGTLTLGYSLANSLVPLERKGAAFGVLSSVTLLGSALSPLSMGALSALDLRAVFVVDSVLYAIALLLALRIKTGRPAAASVPVVA